MKTICILFHIAKYLNNTENSVNTVNNVSSTMPRERVNQSFSYYIIYSQSTFLPRVENIFILWRWHYCFRRKFWIQIFLLHKIKLLNIFFKCSKTDDAFVINVRRLFVRIASRWDTHTFRIVKYHRIFDDFDTIYKSIVWYLECERHT